MGVLSEQRTGIVLLVLIVLLTRRRVSQDSLQKIRRSGVLVFETILLISGGLLRVA